MDRKQKSSRLFCRLVPPLLMKGGYWPSLLYFFFFNRASRLNEAIPRFSHAKWAELVRRAEEEAMQVLASKPKEQRHNWLQR